MTDMLRLSAEVHSKIILQAVPDVTNEELNDIIYKYSFVNPIYYPEWWNVKRFVSTNKNNIDADYKKLVMRAIKSSDPIRLTIIESLALLGNDDDEDLIDFRINECVDEHERLVMRMRNPYYVSYSEDDD
jgi:Icc-related predicted phosphoesterase